MLIQDHLNTGNTEKYSNMDSAYTGNMHEFDGELFEIRLLGD